MTGDERPEVEADEISERMAEVIDEVESIRSETVTPHWETFEDDAGGEPTIYHLHGGRKVETTIVTREGNRRFAQCTEDQEVLDLGSPIEAARR